MGTEDKDAPTVFEFEGEILEAGSITSRRIRDMVAVVIDRDDAGLGFATSVPPMVIPLNENEAMKFGHLLYRRVRVKVEVLEERSDEF